MKKKPKKLVMHPSPFCVFMLSTETKKKAENETEKEAETDTVEGSESDKKGKEDPKPWKKNAK